MNTPLPTNDEVRDLAHRLYRLLDAPEPGLITWTEARNRVANELHRALGQLLGTGQGDSA